MTLPNLGKTLIIANPEAHSGKGRLGAEFTDRFLQSFQSATNGYTLRYTEHCGHATDIAKEAQDFDSVLALGGDGVINEVVNGLMQIPKVQRPKLGIIPMGSGNDYARTLNMSINNTQTAIKELMQAKIRSVEVGCISNGRDSRYFAETLSFGLDAAIAVDTTKRRATGTKSEGEGLFLTSGLKVLASSRGGWKCKATFDHDATYNFNTMIFAIHVGSTYGGGFAICPEANPSDGLLSCCFNQKVPSLPSTLALFGLAKFSAHTHSRVFKFVEAKHIEVEFLQDPAPCQVDGEEFTGDKFIIDVIPDALEVYVGPHVNW